MTRLFLVIAFVFGIFLGWFLTSKMSDRVSLKFDSEYFGIKFPGDEKSDTSVALIFKGEKFNENIELSTLNLLTEKKPKFIGKVIDLNTNGTIEEHSLLWLPNERDEFRERAQENNRFEANSGLYQNMSSHELLFVFDYKNTTVFSVRHVFLDGDSITTYYPTIFINGEYFLTNSLSGDPFIFEFLSTLMRDTFYEKWGAI